MSGIAELRGKLEDRQKKMQEALEQAGPDRDFSKVTVLGDGTSTLKVEELRKLKAEVDDLGEKIDTLVSIDEIAADLEKSRRPDAEGRKLIAGLNNGKRDDTPYQIATLGEMFLQSDAWINRKLRSGGNDGPLGTMELSEHVPDMRATLFQTTAGWAPETTRTGRLVESAQRPIQVIDLIPAGATSQNAIVYMEETTYTNNAAETAEAGTYPESALALTEQSSPVRKIATFIPVTDEQLEDVPGIRSYVEQRLGNMIRQRLDSQILIGNGTPPNLRGINNVVGIQTQAVGADDPMDAVYKLMTKIRVVGRALTTGIVIHPNDWQEIKLSRTTDGIYLWGNPSDALPDRLWGVSVAQSDAQTEGTILLGDFATHSQLIMRRELDVQISNSHGTFFIEGKQAIRADLRAALVIYRAPAFGQVTGA